MHYITMCFLLFWELVKTIIIVASAM